jgi:hypothetical protein
MYFQAPALAHFYTITAAVTFRFIDYQFNHDFPIYVNQIKDISLQVCITGTSIRTPTTVAYAAPGLRPKSMMDTAITTSK